MVINGFGAVCTAMVMIVFAVTKFSEGAWIVILLTPLLVTGFFTIHHHYKSLAGQLSLETAPMCVASSRNRVIILIGGVHQGTLAALRYARRLSDDVTAVHVSTDPAESEKIQKKWDIYGEGYAPGDTALTLPPDDRAAARIPGVHRRAQSAERDHHHRRAELHPQGAVGAVPAHAHCRDAAQGAAQPRRYGHHRSSVPGGLKSV